MEPPQKERFFFLQQRKRQNWPFFKRNLPWFSKNTSKHPYNSNIYIGKNDFNITINNFLQDIRFQLKEHSIF